MAAPVDEERRRPGHPALLGALDVVGDPLAAGVSSQVFDEPVDVEAELAANRRFHFAIMDAPGQPHTLRVIRLLWDSTEAYRAMYYNSPEERRASLDAHDAILEAVGRRDADALVHALDAHRERALDVLRGLLDDTAAA